MSHSWDQSQSEVWDILGRITWIAISTCQPQPGSASNPVTRRETAVHPSITGFAGGVCEATLFGRFSVQSDSVILLAGKPAINADDLYGIINF